MARLNIERQDKFQSLRMDYAKQKLQELGFEITSEDETCIWFMFKGYSVRLFPYSGWHTGKTIKDGRGIDNLLKQLK